MDATWERQSNEAVKILTDDLQEQISPSGRYIIFYCDERTNEVVADAIKFTLTPRCKGQGVSVLPLERFGLHSVCEYFETKTAINNRKHIYNICYN